MNRRRRLIERRSLSLETLELRSMLAADGEESFDAAASSSDLDQLSFEQASFEQISQEWAVVRCGVGVPFSSFDGLPVVDESAIDEPVDVFTDGVAPDAATDEQADAVSGGATETPDGDQSDVATDENSEESSEDGLMRGIHLLICPGTYDIPVLIAVDPEIAVDPVLETDLIFGEGVLTDQSEFEGVLTLDETGLDGSSSDPTDYSNGMNLSEELFSEPTAVPTTDPCYGQAFDQGDEAVTDEGFVIEPWFRRLFDVGQPVGHDFELPVACFAPTSFAAVEQPVVAEAAVAAPAGESISEDQAPPVTSSLQVASTPQANASVTARVFAAFVASSSQTGGDSQYGQPVIGGRRTSRR